MSHQGVTSNGALGKSTGQSVVAERVTPMAGEARRRSLNVATPPTAATVVVPTTLSAKAWGMLMLPVKPVRSWHKVDEESDESFPASDPPGNY